MNILNKYSDWKKPTLLFLLVIWSGWSLPASARPCPAVNGWNNKLINVAFPAMGNTRDKAIGTVLFNHTVYFPANEQFMANCWFPEDYRLYAVFMNGWGEFGQSVYKTNVQGVGIRLTQIGEGGTAYAPTGQFTRVWRDFKYGDPGLFAWKVGDGFRLELIKTGTISTGTLRTGIYASLDDSAHTPVMSINITDGGSFYTTACEVENKSITVPMGDVKRSEFTAVGSTAANKTFNILLNCDASTNIKMTLTATSDSSKAPGVIALNPASGGTVADGVGIQLLNNNNPVTLGAPITIGTAPGGSSRVEMVARYYQTKSTVTAGEANGTATFTFTYN